jgi:hypothetical protein
MGTVAGVVLYVSSTATPKSMEEQLDSFLYLSDSLLDVERDIITQKRLLGSCGS